ncbi:hypothetical protein ACHAW5_002147 [Stephanodiscus triporus]|uniref:Uncharacterized protein n=1 Tax=Stephanodiscus triporus TaxID=2934178 RepID=A0ABD3NDS2_9STRA
MPPPPPSPPAAQSSSSFRPTWQLPPGIEDHMEAFVIKSAIGGTIGAAAGALLRSNAAMGAAFGIGCAAGSFVERGMLNGERVDPAVPKFEIPDVFSGWTGGKKEG